MDIPTRRTVLIPALLTSGLLLTGCSSDELTADDIVERVATAEREAPSFTFQWTAPGADGTGDIRTEGAIRYDDDGEVDLMKLVTTDEAGQPQEDARLVDGTLYHRAGSVGEFTVLEGEEADSFIGAWDWAGATESWGDPESVDKAGEEEVDGVSTTRYEVEFSDSVQTWWIDEDDHMRRTLVTRTSDDTSDAGNSDNPDDLTSEGHMHDFGEDIDVDVPDGVADEG